MTLNNAPKLKKLIISAIECDGHLKRRLLQMGLLPGASVQVVRAAPLGDPIEVKSGDSLVSLRRNEAECVRVETRD